MPRAASVHGSKPIFDLTKPLHLVVRKNGDVTQEDTTASMIFSFADIIAYERAS